MPWARRPWRSTLTCGAVERRALALAQRPDRRAALHARLALASVYRALVLERARVSFGRGEVAQRRAARGERALERRSDARGEAVPARARDATDAAQRMDARVEERL